jgi:GT2 family glycosyltransferase
MLTAVVLNWETPDITARAVCALLDDGVASSRIIVVDNGSTGDSVGRLAAALPGIHVLALDENRGFAGGNNAGAAALPGDAYLFVNSDAFAQPGAVSAILERLGERRVGLVVPRLVNEDGTHQPNVVPRTSFARELVRSSGLTRLVSDPRWSTHWDHDRARRIDCAIGAVIGISGDAWDDLAGFDERRFMYAEDLDLFWRARERGWETWFEPAAEFVHLGGATSKKRWTAAARAEAVADAEGEMVRAHLGAARASATLAVMAAGTGARAVVRRALRQNDQAAVLGATTRGYLRAALKRG